MPADAGTVLTNLLTVNNNGLKAGTTFGLDTTNATAAVPFSTVISNSTGTGGGLVNFTKYGVGTLTMSGSNSYTGVTTTHRRHRSPPALLTNGGIASNIGAAANAVGNIVLAGGTLSYTGSSTSIDRGITGTGGLDVPNAATNFTITGAMISGTITKTGVGALTIGGAGNNNVSLGIKPHRRHAGVSNKASVPSARYAPSALR